MIGIGVVSVDLHLAAGFPTANHSFGPREDAITLGLTFACVVLGMIAHYVYDLRGGFRWLDFLRPLVVSPIVFLPLLGTVRDPSLNVVQIASFMVLHC